MYQTHRSQRQYLRQFNEKKPYGKISRFSPGRQYILDKKTSQIIEVIHEQTMPFKSSGSIFKFLSRHGITIGGIIRNGFIPPKGKELMNERKLILNKKSNLSRKERQVTMGL